MWKNGHAECLKIKPNQIKSLMEPLYKYNPCIQPLYDYNPSMSIALI